MSKTEVSGKQVKDGSIELVDLGQTVIDVLDAKVSASSLSAVATSGSYNDLSNTPSIPSLTQVESDISSLDSRVDALEAAPSFSGSYNDLTDKPTIPSLTQVESDITALDGRVDVLEAVVPFSGSYTDLTNKPSLFSGAYDDLTGKPTLATVATSGSYNDLSNKPSIPSLTGYATESYVDTKVADLVNSAPATLDTLNELATALGNDANFSTTITNAIAAKANTSSLALVATSGSYNDLSNLPSLFSGSYNDLTNKPLLFSGSYNDLSDKPSLFSGSYNDLSNKPTIPSALDDLSDVVVSSSAKGQFLAHNGTSYVNTRTLEADAASTVALTLKGAASQSANLLEVQNSSASVLAFIDQNGNVHSRRYTETVANAFNTSLAPSSGVLTVDTSLGNAILGALSASVSSWAFTNVPASNSRVSTVTVVIAGNASFTYGDACTVNGNSVSGGILWSGGSAPASTAGTDVITFIIVRDSAGTIKVFGSAITNFS